LVGGQGLPVLFLSPLFFALLFRGTPLSRRAAKSAARRPAA